MDSRARLYIQRADNEILLAKINFEISTKNDCKNFLNIPLDKTFFSDVISQSYYAIFYAAKALLVSKGIETRAPEEHKKTYEEFKKIAVSGKLDRQLVGIYEKEAVKAETLLNIFFHEKRKRGAFTYNIKSEANIPYARESIANSIKFVSSLKAVIGI